MLAAYFSDPQRLMSIKAARDPTGVFRSPLLSWVPSPPPSPQLSPPAPFPPGAAPSPLLSDAPTSCKGVLNVDAGGHTCGDRIKWLQDHLDFNQVTARQLVADEFPAECGLCAHSPPPYTTPPPSSPSPPPSACEQVLNVDANGFTCGSRINWLKTVLGLSETASRQQVAEEFPPECGACSQRSPPTSATPTLSSRPPATCDDVLGVLADGHSCGSRIVWVMTTLDFSQANARQLVADEFAECGACASR